MSNKTTPPLRGTPPAEGNTPQTPTPELLADIRLLLNHARRNVAQAVNSAMVQTYWHIGRLIIEHEQSCNARAEYGKQQLASLSESLGKEFGKGFDITNLRNMRRFYQAFPIRETLSPELSWSHYCKIIRLEDPAARDCSITDKGMS